MGIQNIARGLRLGGARGIMAVRAEGEPSLAEIRSMIENVNKTFEDFKKANDEAISDKFKDVVQTEQVEKINAAVDAQQKALDGALAKIAALQVGGAGDDNAPSPEAREHRKAFGKFFRKGVEDGLRDLEVKASLTTDSNPDGGYLVPEQDAGTIDRILGTVSTMRGIAQVMTISADKYKKLVGQGGATGGWVGEKESRPATSTPQLAELEFPAMELYANPAATQTLLDDARLDIGQWLGDEVSITFAEKEGAAFISGTGVNQPRGLAAYTMVANSSYAWGKIGYTAGGVASALTDSTHNGVDAVIDLVYSLKQGYRQNARFLMNRSTQGTLRKLKDDNGNYLWQPSVQAGQPATLAGYPVSDDDNVADIGANAYPIWFGDFRRGYIIVDRFGTRVLRDPYTNKPYVHFYTTKRVGGGVQNFEAIKALKIAAS